MGDELVTVVWLLISAGAVSFAITGLLRRYALANSLLDIPNSRSSHIVPTPRSGGLAFVMAITLSLTWLVLYNGIEKEISDIYYIVIIGGILIATIGLIDDFRHVPARWRLLVHSVVASYTVFVLGIPEIEVGALIIKPNIVLEIIFIIGMIWLINLYNFMDGIDGLAGTEALCVTGGAALIIILGTGYANFIIQSEESNNFTIVFLLLISFVSVFVFLIWNWPPAKIFMGDVGSSYLGYVLGVFMVFTSMTNNLTLWTWLILLGVFFVDSTTTLIIRIITGERWFEAHRTHAYQHAAQRWKSHKKVTMSVFIINMIWLLPLAFLATLKSELGLALTLIAYIPLLSTALILKAGKCLNAHE